MKDEFTEKYRPRSLSEIVGNEHAIRTIRKWGESWKNCIPRLKALTLKGEPGTGKTSAALALAHDMGWDFIEMNASDHRNAASIKKVAGAGSVSQTFTLDGEFLSSDDGRRKLVILDEADNLFGREDFGGAKAIADTIKESRQPIILIVNDFYELSRKAPAIKSLAESATFGRLDAKSIVSVLKSVAGKEGATIPEPAFDHIAENSGGDMRAALNDLQMLAEGRETVTLEDSKAVGKRNQLRDLDHALRTMFGAKTVREARDATFDLDKTPDELVKWIEESIPLEMPRPCDMAGAFDALSLSDVYLGRTRKLQHYGLWSYAKEMMTGGVALSRGPGPRPSVYQYRFPGYFIVMSRAKGPRAARDSISSKLAEYLHTSRKCVVDSTLPYLSVMVKNDQELLCKLVSDHGLDDGDVAYLLGVAVDSPAVQNVISQFGESTQEASAGGKKRGKGVRGTGKLQGF
jgi:replication factor C large subunit